MRSSFHHPRSKINQNKLTISPIFANNPRKEHVKSGDYKFDEISIGSNYSTADCQSQQEMPPSTSAQSLSQSYTQPNPYKSFYEKDQCCETTYHAYTTNSYVDCTTAESLTRKTESLIEKLERFESKLDESKRLIENLRKERKDLISQADRIDAILNTEGSPKSKHRRIVSSGSSPGLVFSNQKPDRGTPHSEHSPMNKFGSKKVSAFALTSQKASLNASSDKRKIQDSSFLKMERNRNSHSNKKVGFV